MSEEQIMREAIELAMAAGKKGNHPFGAVLAHEGEIIARAENTSETGDGYGHAEYNLVLESARRFPDQVLKASTLYTSTAPCDRCSLALLAGGIKEIVYSVSYEGFARLLPEAYELVGLEEIARRLGIEGLVFRGPLLEEEGMQAYQYWGGEFRPLDELLAAAERERTGG